jgi:hypothetical protein
VYCVLTLLIFINLRHSTSDCACFSVGVDQDSHTCDDVHFQKSSIHFFVSPICSCVFISMECIDNVF